MGRAVVSGRGVPDVISAGLDLLVLAVIALVVAWRSDGSLMAACYAFVLLLSPRFSLIPEWLVGIAMWNPVSSTANAVRELFGNAVPTGGSWIEQNALLMAVVWPILVTVVFLPLTIRKYQRPSW